MVCLDIALTMIWFSPLLNAFQKRPMRNHLFLFLNKRLVKPLLLKTLTIKSLVKLTIMDSLTDRRC